MSWQRGFRPAIAAIRPVRENENSGPGLSGARIFLFPVLLVEKIPTDPPHLRGHQNIPVLPRRRIVSVPFPGLGLKPAGQALHPLYRAHLETGGIFRFPPETHRAPVNASLCRDVVSPFNSEIGPAPGHLIQPILRADLNFCHSYAPLAFLYFSTARSH